MLFPKYPLNRLVLHARGHNNKLYDDSGWHQRERDLYSLAIG
jgi:hypothetical protein